MCERASECTCSLVPPVSGEIRLRERDLLVRSHKEWYALVHHFRAHIEHPLGSRRPFASSLLGNHGHGRALVQKPEFAVWVLRIARISVDAAVEHRPVEIADERADVPRAIRLGAIWRRLDRLHVRLQLGLPARKVALVEGVDASFIWDFDVGVREHKLANRRIKREAKDAMADGDDEDRRAAVHAVSRREEPRSWLAHVDDALIEDFLGIVALDGAAFNRFIDAEDGSRRDARIDVAASIERVEYDNVISALSFLDCHRHILFLAGDDTGSPAASQAVAEHLVAHDIEFLLVFALYVFRAGEAREVGDARAVHQTRNLLARHGY